MRFPFCSCLVCAIALSLGGLAAGVPQELAFTRRPPVVVRDANDAFGRAPYGGGWYLDHPCGQVLRLGDGRPHAVLCYRNMDMKEAGGAKPATPFTGAYIEEILSLK